MLHRLLAVGCCAAALAAPLVQADTLGLRLGGYQWQQDYDGTVRSGVIDVDINDDLGYDDETGSVFFIAFEHPVPFLPNIMLQRTELETSATARLNRTIDFDGETYTAATTVQSELDFSHTDATFYYQPLDNWVKLQVGLTVRKFDEGVEIRSLDTGDHSSIDIDAAIPMLYLGARFELPLTGLYVGGDINGIGYSDATLYDGRVNLGYESPIGLGAELGYRRFDLDYDDDDDQADAAVDGAYLALFYHF